MSPYRHFCAQVYKQLLEDYIGSAHYTVPFRIYKCECWKDASEVICLSILYAYLRHHLTSWLRVRSRTVM